MHLVDVSNRTVGAAELYRYICPTHTDLEFGSILSVVKKI
jgi:hypothetical protein